MLKQILKSFIQILKKRPVNTTINIAGLSIGLACFVLAYLFMEYKFSYDSFHKNSDRIVRVLEELPQEAGGITIALNAPCLGKELKDKIPEVEKATTINLGWRAIMSYEDKIFNENSFMFADEDFFDVFSFPLKYAAKSDLLSDPYSIIMSEKSAEKYFGSENPIGKIVTANDSISLKVVGVLEEVKQNSHLYFDMIIPMSFLNAELGQKLTDNWTHYNYFVYLLLAENTNRSILKTKIDDFYKSYDIYEKIPNIKTQPLDEVYLYSDHVSYDWVKDSAGGIMLVYIVIATALAILILACINFMNLITAQSDSRAKEIGVRKVFGSSSRKLIAQLLSENILQTLIAFFFAMVIAEIAHPYFNQLMDSDIVISYLNVELMSTLLMFAVLTGILAGLYPSIFLSGTNPLKALQKEKSNRAKGGVLRKVLVVFQFFVASLLIVSVIFVSRQINFLLNKDLGYTKENLLHLNIRSNSYGSYESFKAKLLANPDVKYVSGTLNLPNWSGPAARASEWEGNDTDKDFMMYHASVDYDFFEAMEMKMISGRTFSREYSMDKTDAVIVNEAAVEAMEMQDPIGKWFDLAGDKEWGMKGKIIGVVKNYNYDNARNKINPLVIKLAPKESSYMLIKTSSGNHINVKKYIEECWNEFYPHKTMYLGNMDETVENLYNTEKSTKSIIGMLTFIAIIISCLGLFGLVLYTIQKKTKEIGIRKIIGANSYGIVKMLSKEYAILILIGNVLAAPLSYFYMKDHLSNYEYHIALDIWPFVVGLGISITFALLTLIIRTHKAANSNPVDAIRYE